MSEHTTHLLGQRRFGPLFLTQFLGAFNDNVFKNALVLLIAFRSGKILGLDPAVVVQLAAGLFVLPFFLFSAMAGQIADKFDKARLIRLVKLVEIGIAALGLAGFMTEHVELLLGALFLLGLHSTFFGPIKYSILPQHLHPDELVAGNAWVESGTFVAILTGSVLAGVLMAVKPLGPTLAGLACLLIALAGYLACRAIPSAPPSGAQSAINLNPFTEIAANLRMAGTNRTVFHAMMGISWFWFYGAIFLSQFAPFVKDVLGGDELLVTTLLATFIVGIALGSFLCERLSAKHVEIGLVPLGSLGLTLFGIDLWWSCPAVPTPGIAVADFLADPRHWRLLADLVLIGVAGGFYTVPLYALLQARARPEQRSRIIAANNILNAAFMVVSALFAGGALAAGASIPQVFLITALMNAAVAFYIYRLVPEFMMRLIVWFLMHAVYRLRTRGLEHIPDEGPAVLVCNHVSFVDALLIVAACRRPIRFVMDHRIFALPVLNFVFRENRAIPIAAGRDDPELLARAYEEIAAALEAGDVVGLFPEGAITHDGEIGPFKNGIARIVARNPVPVVPLALRGLWGSFFSRQGGRAMSRPFRRRPWSRVELLAAPPVPPTEVTPAGLREQVLALRGEMR